MKNLLTFTFLFIIIGAFGQSRLDFNEKQDHVILNGIDLPPPWTIEIFIFKKQNTNYAHLLSSTDGESGIRLKNKSIWIKSNGKTNKYFRTSMPIGEWVHLAFTCDGKKTTLYINGAESNFLPVSIKAPLGRIGYNRKSEKALNSEIDELRIWNSVLPESLIDQYQNDTISKDHPQYEQLVHYYKFDEGGGNIAYDAKGTLNGTITGANYIPVVDKDIRAMEMTSPLPISMSYKKHMDINFKIVNNGLNEINEDFEIKYAVDQGEFVSQTIEASKKPIPSLSSFEVSFPNIDLSKSITHDFQFIVNLPDDEYPFNDTLLTTSTSDLKKVPSKLNDTLQTQIHALLDVWQNERKHDTVRLNALAEIIWKQIPLNTPHKEFFAEKINELETGRNSKKYQSIYHAALAGLNPKGDLTVDVFAVPRANFFKSEQLAKEIDFKEGLTKLYLLQPLNALILQNEEPHIQLERFQLAYNWAKNNSKKRLELTALGELSRLPQDESFRKLGQIQNQAFYFNEQVRLFEELNLHQRLFLLITSKATSTSKINTLEALAYCKKAEKIDARHKVDAFGKKTLFGLMTDIYIKQKDWDNALNYAIKTRENSSKYNNEDLIQIYIGKNDLKKALTLLDSMALTTNTSNLAVPDYAGISKLNYQYGLVYAQQKEYIKSIDAYKKSIAYGSKHHKRTSLLLNIKKMPNQQLHLNDLNHKPILNLGKLYLETKEYSKAKEQCKTAYLFYETGGDIEFLKEACDCSYQAYKGLGNQEEALVYLEKKLEIEKQQAPVETAKQLQTMEFEKQQLSDSLAQVEKDLRTEMTFQAEIQQKNQTRNIAFGIGALIFLLAAGLWSRLRFTNKAKVEIEKQKDRAEQSEKYKEQFLANMSHEIRTPMHAISGMTKILKRNQHGEDQKVYLNAIDQSSNNLLVILNDVLDLSKIEAGKIRLESMPMNPRAVMENVMDILKFKAEDKGLYLSANIAEDIPSLTVGDPNRLNQILLNLTGNAIKFTEKGTVKINLDEVEQEGKPQLQFTVEDTGVGIPKDQLERIFDSFEQGDKTLGKKFGGTGLGLHISKELIELQEGNIWVESEVGQGSRFIFTLPLIIGEGSVESQVTLSEEKLKAMGEEMAGLKILLAEDNDFNALVATDDLSYYIPDVKIKRVENGLDALALFQKGKYDIILMDMQMPEMNGFEASERIRVLEKELEDRTPIIAMTASLLKAEIQQCFDAGMDNYIPKPYKAEELIGRIYSEVKSKS